MLKPLRDISDLERRYDGINLFMKMDHVDLVTLLIEKLKQIGDGKMVDDKMVNEMVS